MPKERGRSIHLYGYSFLLLRNISIMQLHFSISVICLLLQLQFSISATYLTHAVTVFFFSELILYKYSVGGYGIGWDFFVVRFHLVGACVSKLTPSCCMILGTVKTALKMLATDPATF